MNDRGVEVSWLKQTCCYLHDNSPSRISVINVPVEKVLLIQRQQIFSLPAKTSHLPSYFERFDGRNIVLLCVLPLY